MVRYAVRMCDRSTGETALVLAQNSSGKSSECNEVHSVEDHQGKQALSVHATHSHPTLRPTPSRFFSF